MKVGEGWVCWVQLANMWQHCSVTAVQRKTAYHCLEESWWPEFNLSGSMPWCSFPWHKHLPRLAQKNCCTVYSLNLIHEITSLFSTNLLYADLPRKAFPGEQAKVDTGHKFFLWLNKQRPKIRPRPAQWLFSNERTWWNNWTHCSNEYVEWKLEKAEFAEFNMSTCGKIAVCQLCRGSQPLWKSRDGLNLTCLDQCHGVRFHGTSTSQGWRKKIVVQSTLQSKFDPWVYIPVFNQPALCRLA